MTPIGVTWRVFLALGGVGAGLVSVRVGFPAWQVGAWLGDLLTGWAVITAGLLGTLRRASLRTGALLVLGGFAWFLADWTTVGGPVGGAATAAMFLHRGFLLHALFTAPVGRAASREERIAVVAAYAASLVPWIWTNAVTAVAASALAVGLGVLFVIRAPGLLRPAKRGAVAAIALVAASIGAGFAIRAIWEVPAAASVALVVYEAAFVIAAVSAVAISVTAARTGAAADLVVEFGAGRGGGLEGALRWALGDDELVVGYGTGVPGEFVDSRGGRVATGADALPVIGAGDREVATIRAAAGTLDDPALRASVTAAVRLDAANRALRSDVEAQAEAVRASQRRIISAGDEESRRLAERLHAGVGARLDDLAAAIDSASEAARSEKTKAGLAEARSSLARAHEDLGRLARGLDPQALGADGLAGALTAVARDAVLPVDLAIDDALRLPMQVEAAVYFLCLEGLANVAKHASADRVSITVKASPGGRVRVEIRDDGVGGAALAAGAGLRGLADRVAALGGTLGVSSPEGGGTTLSAILPAGEPPGSRSAPTGGP